MSGSEVSAVLEVQGKIMITTKYNDEWNKKNQVMIKLKQCHCSSVAAAMIGGDGFHQTNDWTSLSVIRSSTVKYDSKGCSKVKCGRIKA